MEPSANRPSLRQYGELRESDFDADPVWVSCHLADHGEPWFDETDEETFRPWSGPGPADPGTDILLVRATAVLNDGSRLAGFLTPSDKADDFGTMQPQVFIDDRPVGFWGGLFGVPESTRARVLERLGKAEAEVFPIEFASTVELAGWVTGCRVAGWMKFER